MQRIDALIAAVLVLAATGSVAGVVLYEEEATPGFDLDFVLEETGLLSTDGARAGPGDVEVAFEVAAANITEVRLVVEVGAGGLRPVASQVTATLHVPGQEPVVLERGLASGGAVTVPLAFTVPVQDAPEARRVEAEDAGAAAAMAPAASSLGQGTWHLIVSFTAAHPIEALDDAPRTVHVTGDLTAYHVVAGANVPEVH